MWLISIFPTALLTLVKTHPAGNIFPYKSLCNFFLIPSHYNSGKDVQNSIPAGQFCAQQSSRIQMAVVGPQRVEAKETQELLNIWGGKRLTLVLAPLIFSCIKMLRTKSQRHYFVFQYLSRLMGPKACGQSFQGRTKEKPSVRLEVSFCSEKHKSKQWEEKSLVSFEASGSALTTAPDVRTARQHLLQLTEPGWKMLVAVLTSRNCCQFTQVILTCTIL